jgi:hypothetical protein
MPLLVRANQHRRLHPNPPLFRLSRRRFAERAREKPEHAQFLMR